MIRIQSTRYFVARFFWHPALVAVVLTVLLPITSISAQDAGVIRLVSEERTVSFPDGLEITVTVEGPNQLAEARLNYRLVGSRVWAYVSRPLPAQNRATVRFEGLLEDSVHLPPGTKIEYFYTFSDVLGISLETPVDTFEYADDRFQWEELSVGPLTLFYHDIPTSRVEGLAEELETDLERVRDILQLQQVTPIRGFVYNNYLEAEPAFPNQSRTITQQQVFHGFAFAESSVFLSVGLDHSIIVHESAHLMLDQYLEFDGRPIPAWLNEGFASYVERGSRYFGGPTLGSREMPLRAMISVSGTPEDVSYFYLKSESVVAYLIDAHGVESFRQFLDSLGRGSDVDSALGATYGFDTQGLDAAWASSNVGSSPGRFNPTTPFLLFNSWFLASLILIVMTIVLVRYIIRKVRPPSDSDPFYWD